jgi:hypothetical protein
MSLQMKFLSAVISTGLFGCSFVLMAPTATAGKRMTPDEVTLIRLKPDPNAVSLTAELEGKLQVRNGCVYLISKRSKLPVLAIWPSTYRLLSPKGVVTGVTNTSTGQSLKFGVNAVFGGGETKIAPTDMLEAPVPTACSGRLAYVEFSD